MVGIFFPALQPLQAFLERGVTDGFGITLYILEMFFIQDFMTFEFYLLNTSGSGSRYFISRLPDCPVIVPARFGERKYRSRQARMIFFQPTPQGPDLAGYTGHGATFAGWEIK